MVHRRDFVAACVVAFFVVGGAGVAAEGPEDAAQAAAESWLRLVDDGDYSASWDRAAKAFKGAVKRTEWGQDVGGVRAALGNLVSRKLKSRQYLEKGPTTRVIGGKVYSWGGDGKCVVLQYQSAFANKASALETVIPMADPDGVWRVSGYSVR